MVRSKSLNICVVDDEEIIRVSISDDLNDSGHNVVAFKSPELALEFLANNSVDVVISDIRMPGMHGIEFLSRVKKVFPEIYVILMTAYGSVQTAVDAMKMGAFDYLLKPFEPEELNVLLDKILEFTSLKKINKEFSNQFKSKYGLESFFGESKSVADVKKSIAMVAQTNSNVLITGETGTGKELISNIIHYNSKRNCNPLIKVSCAILSRDLFESELFGHVRGAFTGADKDRAGRFEDADGGTLYLDDIDDVPLELQVKLLRVLQEGEIERLGSSKPIKVDVRILASTKKDLKQLVAQGKFREDLYYRLNVWPIYLKPLRERREDIPILFKKFLKEFSGNQSIVVEPEVFEILKNYSWLGNTRELKNLAERMTILAYDGVINVDKLPMEYLNDSYNYECFNLHDKSLSELLVEFEKSILKNTMIKSKGNKTRASEILGIPPSTLRSKLSKYNLE